MWTGGYECVMWFLVVAYKSEEPRGPGKSIESLKLGMNPRQSPSLVTTDQQAASRDLT